MKKEELKEENIVIQTKNKIDWSYEVNLLLQDNNLKIISDRTKLKHKISDSKIYLGAVSVSKHLTSNKKRFYVEFEEILNRLIVEMILI